MKRDKIIHSTIVVLLVLAAFSFFISISKNRLNTNEKKYEYSRIDSQDVTFDIIKVGANNTKSIAFYYKDDTNKKINDISTLKSWLKNREKNLVFATNGGIFSKSYTPMGLYIENEKKISEININNGEGNFYLKPNGVFLIQENEAKIVESLSYQDSNDTSFAIQSGPLLVSQGKTNSLFSKNSQSRYIRNGVGITLDKEVVFAISNAPVTFYEFATFFKESLNCKNALYLDGAISEMYIPEYREGAKNKFSTIIGIVEE